jgi:hypothetical protein
MLGNLHVGCIPMTASPWSSERVPTSQIGEDDVPGDGPTALGPDSVATRRSLAPPGHAACR